MAISRSWWEFVIILPSMFDRLTFASPEAGSIMAPDQDPRRSSVRKSSLHSKLKRRLPWAFTVYLMVGFAAAATPHRELFPFFSWFLFPLTPGLETRWQLRFHQLHGTHLDEPIAFEQADLWVDTRSVDAQFLIQALGEAVEQDDLERVARWRALLESRFVPPSCAYVLVRRRYDPLEALRGAPDRETREVATFRCDAEAINLAPSPSTLPKQGNVLESN